MNRSFRKRRGRVGALGVALGLLAALVPFLSSPASADTPTTHTVRASTGTLVNIAPPGPLSGLVDLQTVTLRVTEAGPTDQISAIAAVRLCDNGVSITNAAEMLPGNTGYCLDQALSAGSNYYTGPIFKASGADNFIETTFKVGVGTRVVPYDDGTPQTNTITCNSTNDCSIWLQIARSGGNDFIHFDLKFLGAPGAPTGVGATCTATGANVTWTAPANLGNGTINRYTITATPTAGGAAVAPVNVDGTPPATTGAISGLTFGSPYDITVTARNVGSNGTSTFTSAASTPTVSVTPCAAGPVLAPAVVGDGAADLSWTYSGPAGHTGYEIRVQQISPAGPDQVIAVSGAGTLTRTVTGLTNGTLYRATVRAVYPTSFSAYSNAQDFSPASTFITQTIKVRRPQGALVLTQVCTQGSVGGTPAQAPAWNTTGGSPAVAGGYYTGGTADPLYSQYPYPQDALTGDSVAHYPTDCGIDLGAARLMVADDPSVAGNESGQFFQATGALNQVTVVDTRDTDPGWTVNGKMGTFTQSIPGAVIVGDQLGWTPIMTDDSDLVTFSDGTTYDQAVTAGPSVAPNQPSGTGLGSASGRQLATSPDPANAGLGIAKLDATLKLWIPITARTGNYIGVLTLTAV